MSGRKLSPGWALFGLLALGLLLRVAFLLKGATIYYGPGQEFLNGDSFSFTRSFVNLWHTGHYTLEPLIPEASFGRLPGYPLFYGLHYLLWGPERASLGVALTQILLDTASIWLIYNLLRRWHANALVSLLGAAIYATYPFAIVWVTVTGTECLNTFCTLLWLTVLTKAPGRRWSWHYAAVGLLTAVVFFVRAYMGLLLPVAFAYVVMTARHLRWRAALGVLVGFGALYCWWPLRNYVNHNRLVLIKPASAGYANQREDMQAYLDWLHCWTNDNTTWVEGLVHDRPLRYPADVFASLTEARRAQALTGLARHCGSSFYLRRLDTHNYKLVVNRPNCNAAIAAGFDSLRHSYVHRHPLRYAFTVPLANLQKAVFKSATIRQSSGATIWLQRLLFVYRTAGVLLGLVALALSWRKPAHWPVAAFALSLYLYISFDFRSLEMRYLLQADVLLLLPATWLLGCWLSWRKQSRMETS